MATDVYIKFGESKDGGDGTDIEGDSTDEKHYWWCEARNCGFDLEAGDPDPGPAEGDGSEQDKKKSKAKFKTVTLKKRVDWASTQLFLACCEQAMALSKSKAVQEKGWIDIVTIHVCRPAPGDKIAFVTIEYHGVRLIHYSIEMSEPEPSESITFEFQKLKFQQTQIDTYSGQQVKAPNAVTSSGLLPNSGTGQSGVAHGHGAAPAGNSAPAATPGSSGVVVPTGGGGTGANSGTSATPGVSEPDSYVGVMD